MRIELLAYLVPSVRREEWLAEWRAELAFLVDRPLDRRALAAGAWSDALHLRLEWMKVEFAQGAPLRLLAGLACAAGASAVIASRALHIPGKAPAFAFLIAFALLILPATMPIYIGDYSSVDNRRRRAFFAAKMTLVLAACYFLWCAALPHVKHGSVHATMKRVSAYADAMSRHQTLMEIFDVLAFQLDTEQKRGALPSGLT